MKTSVSFYPSFIFSSNNVVTTTNTITFSAYGSEYKIKFPTISSLPNAVGLKLVIYASIYTSGPNYLKINLDGSTTTYEPTQEVVGSYRKLTYNLTNLLTSNLSNCAFSLFNNGPLPTVLFTQVNSTYKPVIYYECLTNDIHYKGDTFKNYDIGDACTYRFSYEEGTGLFNIPLFNDILPYSLSLVFNPLTNEYKISPIDELYIENKLLVGSDLKIHRFGSVTNTNFSFIDQSGEGLILSFAGNGYVLSNPLLNGRKIFNLSGELVRIMDEKFRSIYITRSSNSITLTDSNSNEIVLETTYIESTDIETRLSIYLNNTLFYTFGDILHRTYNARTGLYVNRSHYFSFKKYKDNSALTTITFNRTLSNPKITGVSVNNYHLSLTYDSDDIVTNIDYYATNTSHYISKDSYIYGNSVFIDDYVEITNLKGVCYRYYIDYQNHKLTHVNEVMSDGSETLLSYSNNKDYEKEASSLNDRQCVHQFSDPFYYTSGTSSTSINQIGSSDLNFSVFGSNKRYLIKATIEKKDGNLNDGADSLITLTLTFNMNVPGTNSDKTVSLFFNKQGAYREAFGTLIMGSIEVSYITGNLSFYNVQSGYYQLKNLIIYEEGFQYVKIENSSTSSEFNYSIPSIEWKDSSNAFHSLSDFERLSNEDMKINQVLKAKGLKCFFYNNLTKLVYSYTDIKIIFVVGMGTADFLFSSYNFAFVNNKLAYIETDRTITSNDAFSTTKTVEYDQNTYLSSTSYNNYNQPTVSSDEHNIISTYAYDSNHNLVSLAIGPSNAQVTTTYTYDSNNRLYTKTEPITSNISNVEEYHYKSTYDLLDYIKDPNNISLTYGYASTSTYNYVSSITKDNKSNSNTYTSNRLTSITSNTSPTFSYTYDDYNLLSSIKLNNNNLVTIVNTLNDTSNNNYDYQTVTYSNNYSYTLTKDKYNRLISLKEGSTDKIIYQYGYITSNNPLTYDISNPYNDAKLLYTIDYYVNDTECYFYDSSNRVNKIERYHSTNVSNLTNLYITKNIGYDSLNRVTGFNININNDLDLYSTVINYESYKEDISSMIIFHYFNNIPRTIDETITRDNSRRLYSISTDSGFITKYYGYHQNTSNLESMTVKDIDDNVFYKDDCIGYDNKGNIISYDETLTISNNDYDSTKEYTYDHLNRLIQENITNTLYSFDIHYQYIYDNNGNITSVKTKNSLGTYDDYLTFTYNSTYVDRLDSFIDYSISNNPISLTYDNFLNPTSIGDKTFAYTRGRLLESYKVTPNTITNYIYSYNKDGIRTSKFKKNIISPSNIIPLEEHKYYYDNKKLIMEERVTYTLGTISSTNYLRYFYSSEGVKAFLYNNSLYYYLKDIFNNVVALLNTSNNVIARYSYDSYGNTLVLNPDGTINNNDTFIGNINPFRYRSYYYDNELEMYYCLSRYYYPYIRRWLNGDDLNYLDKDTLGGINLYAYCLDNPVMYRDEDGHIAILLAFALVGAAVNALSYSISKAILSIESQQNEWRLSEFIGSVVGGMVSGLFSACGAPIIGSATGELISTSISMFLSNNFEGTNYSREEILMEYLRSIVIGAFTGCISKGLYYGENLFGFLKKTGVITKSFAEGTIKSIGLKQVGVIALNSLFDEIMNLDGIIKSLF